MFDILVINPGSTSTKVAFFRDHQEIYSQNLQHSADLLAHFPNLSSQFLFRLEAIEAFLGKNDIRVNEIDAFVGRGGLLRPIPSGTYLVNEAMIQDLIAGAHGEHASNLGAILAKNLADRNGKPAFIVDPVVVDEMQEISRFSGHPLLPRKSIFHALNHKAVGHKAAMELGKTYESCNFIIAHLGGGISVAAHQRGRVIDVNNALDGDGPFSPERSGTLPAGDLVRLCFSGMYDAGQVQKMLKGGGGLVAYLGSNDMLQINRMIEQGDAQAELIYKAMSFQVAREIASHGATLKGQIDAIILTGGIAYDSAFVEEIKTWISFLGTVLVFPGEQEMEALASGVLRVLEKIEKPKTYTI